MRNDECLAFYIHLYICTLLIIHNIDFKIFIYLYWKYFCFWSIVWLSHWWYNKFLSPSPKFFTCMHMILKKAQTKMNIYSMEYKGQNKVKTKCSSVLVYTFEWVWHEPVQAEVFTSDMVQELLCVLNSAGCCLRSSRVLT